MNAGLKLGAFAALVGAVFAGAMAAGAAVGPIDTGGAAHGEALTTRADTTVMVHGYEVTLTGEPAIGTADLAFEVRRDGRMVASDPQLDASGRLVVIRSGDLTYVPAVAQQTADATAAFTTDFPSAGDYRLYFEFVHDTALHLASFDVVVPDGPATPVTDNDPAHGGH